MPDTSIFGGGNDQAEAYTNAANIQAASASQAAAAQLQAARESNELIKTMYQYGRADLAPWRATGQTALDVYSGLLGLPSMYSTPLPQVPGQEYPEWPTFGKEDTSTAGKTTTGTAPASSAMNAANVAASFGKAGYFVTPGGQIYTGTGSNPVYIQTPDGGFVPASGTQYYPGTNAPAPAATANPTAATNALTLKNYNKAISAPSARMNATDWIKQTPGYEFQYNEGINALDRSAASRGMLLSGAQTRAAQEYGQNFALGQYDNYMNKLANLAGIGQTSASQTSQAGTNMANASAQNTMQAATNAAQANMAGANAIGSGYVNAANAAAANQQNMMNNVMGLGGLGLAAYSIFSDRRLKKDIESINSDVFEIIGKLDPVHFKYNFDDHDQIGFIADDLDELIPEAVFETGSGLKMISPMPILALLVKAIQEQQKVISALQEAQNV